MLTITKAALTVTADDKWKPYGAALPVFTASYTGFVSGDTSASLDEPVVFATPATANSPVGTYPIEASGGADSNYTIQFNGGNLTVARAPLTITADAKTKVYGAALPELTATCSGFVNGETLADLPVRPSLSTTVVAGSAPGSYQIRVSGGSSPNYTLILNNGVLTVTKAHLVITAEDQRMQPGLPVPPLTAAFTGFVNGDGPGSLSKPVKLATTADPSSPPGTYPILPSGADSPNYEIAFVPGTLTVVEEIDPPVLRLPSRKSQLSNAVAINVKASAGSQVRLEWSEDLVSWTQCATQRCSDYEVTFEIEMAPGRKMSFFRAVLLTD
jgi:hypothetical protein